MEVSHLSSKHQSGDTYTQAFSYRPLSNAATFIRLLRVSYDMKDTSSGAFEMIEYGLDSLLEYAAISYEWGSSIKSKNIIINGTLMSVTANAAAALDQVCSYNFDFDETAEDLDENDIWYVWMDAICINQDDLDEKSLQVAMMSNIYAMAAVVYACVGPTQAWSELLPAAFDAIRDTERYNQLLDLDDDDFDPSIGVEWLMSQEEEHLINICGAFGEFANRSYWSRMWIVQELYSANICIVMCGSDAFNIADVYLFKEIFEALLDEELPIEWRYCIEAAWARVDCGFMRRATMLSPGSFHSFGETLAQMKDFHCRDTRDRVYALNSMISWGENQPSVKPDYTISIFDLLIKTLGNVRHSNTDSKQMYVRNSFCELVQCGVLEALGIDMAHPQIQAAVESRRQHQLGSRPNVSQKHSLLLREYSYAISSIKTNSQGRLSVAFTQVLQQAGEATELLRILTDVENSEDAPSPIFDNGILQRLFSGSSVVGIACNGAQDGDYLYPFNVERGVKETSQIYLIVRRRSDDHFTIIGQAVIFANFAPDSRFPTKEEIEASQYRVTQYGPLFELCLLAEDIVVLMAQDLVINANPQRLPHLPSSGVDLQARFKRVATGISMTPECGARIIAEPSSTQEHSAVMNVWMIGTSFEPAKSQRGYPEYQLSQTHTGFVFWEGARPVRSFSGPIWFTPHLCPIHGNIGKTTIPREPEKVLWDLDRYADVRQVECTCHILKSQNSPIV